MTSLPSTWPGCGCAAALLVLCACGEPQLSPACIPSVGDSPVRGPAGAWVTMIELADFQCPYCAAVQPTVTSLESVYGDDLRVVFKHLPLEFHERARPAAIAAECAHAQGSFWPVHDHLFAERDLTEAGLVAAATTAGIDLDAWHQCRAGPVAAGRVDADVRLARAAGVSGTPTFFINGTAVVGALPASEFRSVIDARLAEACASGIDSADYYERAVKPLCAGSH